MSGSSGFVLRAYPEPMPMAGSPDADNSSGTVFLVQPRRRYLSESSTMSTGSSTDDFGCDREAMAADIDEQCPVCYEDLEKTNIAWLSPGCGHSFCMTCILRWGKVRQCCPMCQSPFTHVVSHYRLDGTFTEEPVDNVAEWMQKVTWLDLGFAESPSLQSPRLPRGDDRVYIEEDIYGLYQWDQFDDEYDLDNFAPSRGKDGRRRKSDAGCVSVTDHTFSLMEDRRPNRQQSRRHSLGSVGTGHVPGASAAPAQSNGETANAAGAAKLGRRARRAMMRRLADERAASASAMGLDIMSP